MPSGSATSTVLAATEPDGLFLRAHVHRHHGPEEPVLHGLPVQLGISGHRAGHYGQHHIVHRAAAGRANGARFGEGELGPEHATLAGAGAVKGQVLQRRQQFGHPVDYPFESHRRDIVVPQQGAIAHQCIAHVRQPFGNLRQAVGEGVHEKGGSVGGIGRPVGLSFRQPALLRGRVQHYVHQPDSGDPIHDAMMHLANQGRASVRQSIDHVHFPERLVAVQQGREDAAGQLAQLFVAARRIELHVDDVAPDVEVQIVLPGRVSDVQEGEHHLFAVAGDQIQLGFDGRDEALERDGAFEDAHAADVQGHLLALEIEKRRIQRAEAGGEFGKRHETASFWAIGRLRLYCLVIHRGLQGAEDDDSQSLAEEALHPRQPQEHGGWARNLR